MESKAFTIGNEGTAALYFEQNEIIDGEITNKKERLFNIYNCNGQGIVLTELEMGALFDVLQTISLDGLTGGL
jgi:hypothetical protein